MFLSAPLIVSSSETSLDRKSPKGTFQTHLSLQFSTLFLRNVRFTDQTYWWNLFGIPTTAGRKKSSSKAFVSLWLTYKIGVDELCQALTRHYPTEKQMLPIEWQFYYQLTQWVWPTGTLQTRSERLNVQTWLWFPLVNVLSKCYSLSVLLIFYVKTSFLFTTSYISFFLIA